MTELLLGGELLDAVLERGSYSEADARLCFVQLLRGIEYLHERCGLPYNVQLPRGIISPVPQAAIDLLFHAGVLCIAT